jgi:hypothetical protein
MLCEVSLVCALMLRECILKRALVDRSRAVKKNVRNDKLVLMHICLH